MGSRDLAPLSVEGAGGGAADTRFQIVRRAVCARRAAARRLCFVVALLLAAALLSTKKAFHLSFSNLFGTIVGRKHHGDAIAPVCYRPPDDARSRAVSIGDVDLDRQAIAFKKSLTPGVISEGFNWNDEDARTAQWRPQGVSTLNDGGRNFALVSWYGRKDEGFADRGGRISVVDTNSLKYRHILLVDDQSCALPGIHVGGIDSDGYVILVVDSRKDQRGIIEFDFANDLYDLGENENFYGYRYVARASRRFPLPVKPSFLSFDPYHGLFVVGTYKRCGPKLGVHLDVQHCADPGNELFWFNRSEVGALNRTSCGNFWSEMQGVVTTGIGNKTLLLTSSSYGGIASSHLHMSFTSARLSVECPVVDITASRTFTFPPGLEDLHIDGDRDLWSCTEFGDRVVFKTALSDLLGI